SNWPFFKKNFLTQGLCLKYFAVPSYGERGSDLGIQVFQQVARAQPQDNVVLSPHGVASILGMLLPGAHGETRRQMLNGLRYKANGPYKMLKKLHKSLTNRSNQDLVTIANAVFVQQGFNIKEPFMSTNKDNFQCESTNLDFGNTHAAAESVNSWVKNRTKGMITSLIKPEMLDPAFTRMVVVNSIYFKGLWKSRFQPENTKIRNFHGPNGVIHKVPMMSQLSVFNIGQAVTPQGLKYKVIELPYHGNSISMLIALPVEDDVSISAIIPHVSTGTVQSWTKLLHPRKVRLLLPRFSAEAEVDLKDPLLALGIKDMFSQGKADFRHISQEPLHVSKTLQKAKIEVNEDGTKASAATTAILLARSSPPWVTVDRPFLFVIRHNSTGTILFMGQINKP
uniref:Serpin peptidase inhibitor, clade E (nexin, plasminogen activator inhibitor type 1), member 2 n=1 Tax=Scleropages formosus TaxID=113540 RepID=A0A8C9T734_SCLFO